MTKKENILLVFPTPAYELAALAVAQQYVKQLHATNRKATVDLVCSSNGLLLDRLIDTLATSGFGTVYNNYRGHGVTQRQDYDFIFEFDVSKAEALAAANKMHVATAFAIMLGVENCRILPDLTAEKDAINFDVLLSLPAASTASEKLSGWIRQNYPLLKVCTDFRGTGGDVDATLVIARQSQLTYHAAAMGRGRYVVEFYDMDDKWPGWLGLWSYPNYKMIEACKGLQPELVWRTIDNICRKLSVRYATAELSQTAQ